MTQTRFTCTLTKADEPERRSYAEHTRNGLARCGDE
jgi:hypothetical protein